MKYILTSTALLGCALGAAVGVLSPDQSYGVLDKPVQAVSQAVNPAADAVQAPISAGSCTFYDRGGFRGRSQTIRYRGNGNNFRVGNININAISIRLRGGATVGLFTGRNLGGRALTSRPDTTSFRDFFNPTPYQIRRASNLSRTRSAVCGIRSSVAVQLR